MTFAVESSIAPDLQPMHPDRIMNTSGTWEQFQLIRQGFESNSAVRLFYLNGIIEILMPGQSHEIFSHAIGVLLSLFLAIKGIVFVATGSADQVKEGCAIAQPDESYCIGHRKAIPDLSIEVVFTSGGINKLDTYRALGSTEVWFWKDGTLELYHLRQQQYDRIQTSELPGLEDLDLALLKRCVLIAETNLGEAINTFIQAISR
jgi:Uma2 family endonuclease